MTADRVTALVAEIDRLCGNGDIDQAINCCRHALENQDTPPDSRWLIAAHTGRNCLNVRQLADAIKLLVYALEVKPAALEAVQVMRLHIDLAIAHCCGGSGDDFLRAVPVLQQGLAIHAETEAHHPERAQLHGHLGNAMSMLGAHATAETHHRDALAHARKSGDPDAIALWTGDLGTDLLRADDAEAAIPLFTEALASAPDAVRAQNGDRWEQALQHARALIAKRNSRPADFAHTPSAFVFDGLAPRVSTVPSVPDKKALIESERAKIDAAIKETIAEREPLEAAALIDCVKSLVGRELMYRKRLEMSSFGGSAARENTAVVHGLRVGQFAEYLALDRHQCFISFYYTDQHDYYAFIGTAAEGIPRVERVTIASGYAGYRMSQHLQSLLERRRADPDADIERTTMNVLSELSLAILPRLKRVPGIQRVLLSPYKLLHCLPLHAMMARDEGAGMFLEDFGCVSYAGSFMSHLAARTSLPKPQPKQDCVVFAYVEKPGDESIDPLEADAYHVAFGGIDWLRTTRDPDSIPEDLGDVPFICWSSHAVSDPTTWDSSYLSAGDRQISASTIIERWSLRETHCAVLSGCETACDNSMGDAVDEYFGLDQAVHIAGANSVIGTIYPVRDDFAGIMTLVLLEGMVKQRLSPSEALRQARTKISSGEWTRNLRAAYDTVRAEKGPRLDAQTRRFFDRAMAIDPSAFAPMTCWANYRCLGNW